MDTKKLRIIPALIILSGCSVGPDFQAPPWHFPPMWNISGKEKAIGVPATVEPVEGQVAPDWWTVFDDPILNDMEDSLEAQNLDIQTSVARLLEARAERGISTADFYPEIDGSASFTRQKPSNKGAFNAFGGGASGAGANNPAFPTSSKIKPFNLFQYGFDASWELDLWGGVRRGVESADAQLLAAEETQRDTLLSAQAELARNYIDLRGTQATYRVAKADIEAAQSQADLKRAQAVTGLSSEEDTMAAEAQVSTQSARLPQLAQQEIAQINAIELLLGQPPGTLTDTLASKSPPLMPKTVPVEVPSDLVRRRPDIRAAEARLHAATADIGVAAADFYPSITLMGSGAIQGTKFRNLGDWSARTWSFGPSISLPIFQGGRLTGTLELRKAQQREAAIAYRKTVLQALHEVDNALTAVIAEQKRQKHLDRAEQQQALALKLARSRFSNGLSSFLEVNVAQQNLFAAEQQTVESRTALSGNVIQLYKAMGGGIEN